MMADPAITPGKPSKVVISVFKKRICTNNTEVNGRGVVEQSNTLPTASLGVISAFKKKNCINNTGVNRGDVIVEPSNTQPTPSLGVISAFKKRNCIINTGVNIRDIVKQSNTQPTPSLGVISAFKKRNCINNTGENRRDVIVEPSNTQLTPSLGVISAFKKRNCINNTGENRRDVIVEPSNTQLTPSLGVISVFKISNCTNNTGVNRGDIVEPSNSQVSAFKESKNCTNNTVGNLNSIAQENSIQKKEQSQETANQLSLRVWSGAIKDKNNVNDSNSIKDPKLTKTKEQCRVCLMEGSIPIYGDNSNEDLADAVMTIGGVEISPFDPYPKYLCRLCLKLLLNAVMFRNMAQMSDQKFLKLTETEEPVKLNNTSISEDDDFSDDDINNDSEDPDVPEKPLIFNTKLIDQLTKLHRNQTETRAEPKKINTNKHMDDSSKNNKEYILLKYLTKIPQNSLAANATKLINIVMPIGGCNTHDGNTLNEHLDQNITKILLKSSMTEHAKINDGDHSSGKGNTLQESLNQMINKILQKIPETKLEQANIVNIIMPSEDHSSLNDNVNTLQENKENVNEILQKIPELKSEHSKVINIVMPRDCHYSRNINKIIKKSSGTTTEHTKIDNVMHTNDHSNNDNIGNTLQENINNNISAILDKSIETEPDPDKMPPEDYFGDIAKHKSDRERNYKKLEPLNVICEECGELCDSYKEYTSHYVDKHPEIKKVPCKICEKDYSVNYFARHMFYHSQGPFVCDICGKHIVDLQNFNGHRRIHSTELPFKCSLCAYRGRYKKSVIKHMMIHTGERPYQCPQCPKKFINTGNLKRHILQHTGERPFRCETCKRGFITKGDLQKHNRNIHLGRDKHNICRFCGMSFNSKNNWSKHERQVHKRPKFRHKLPLYVKFDIEALKNSREHLT